MENTDPSKSAVGPPFIAAANALANLYKKAATVEKEARQDGARSAYMNVMQWAAQKSHRNEKITPSELIALCSQELAKVPAPSPAPRVEDENVPVSTTSAPASTVQQNNTANQNSSGSGGDTLVSDIRKLQVNPPRSRKRPRMCISDTFIRAVDSGNTGNLFSIGTSRPASSGSNDRDRPVPIFGSSFDDGMGSANRSDSSGANRKKSSIRNAIIEKQRRK